MRTAARYSTSLLTTVVAILLTGAFAEFLAPMRLFFFWCAVLITALIAGVGPAFAAIALAIAGAAFLVFDPVGEFALRNSTDIARVGAFALFSGAIAVAVGLRRNAERRAAVLSEQLRVRERRYRTLVEATPVSQAVWTATPDGVIRWSEAWAAITGQTTESLEAGGGMEAVHPDDRARTSERWSHALATRTFYQDELRVRIADGRYRWFAIKAVPVQDGGRITEWVGLIVDIDARKRHEDDAAFINRASAVLSSSLGYEQTMHNLARLAVPAIADWCGIDIGSGEGYVRLVVEHADPDRLKLLRRFDDYRPPADKDPIVQVMQTGRVQLLPEIPDELLASLTQSEEQLAVARALGLRSWIIAPMMAHGRTLGTLTVVHGESGRRYTAEDVPLVEELARRAATALENARLYEAAEAANRAKDQFLATLSHELRTPLTAISGWAHMLEAGLTDDATTRLAIETIVRSARSQAELIDDLLDLSQVVAGTLRLDVKDVDLSRVAQDAMVAARPAGEARGLTLELQAPMSVFVRGDERRLRQIAWNLVSNAVKFTGRGGTVRVSVNAGESNATLEVADTGRGIDPEFLPYVWDRFRQGDSSTSREYGGLGLGLSVVHHLVELHGGRARAESAGVGRGARFIVELPLAHLGERVRSGATVDHNDGELRGKTVLLVDDDDASRLVIAAMLRQLGASVVAAPSAAHALALAEGQAFDAVVSDIAMPGEDGYSFARKIRNTSAIPIIAVSAISTGPDDRQRALAAGFSDFVRKPLELRQLAEALQKHL